MASALALSSLECDLVLLAGLPDEHEGYADVLRTVHPRTEPRPTVALAAQLTCPDMAGRHDLRETLVSGPAVATGLLRVTGDAPFLDRNLELAEATWAVFHGLDAWPAAVTSVPGPVSRGGLARWLAAPDVCHAKKALCRGAALTVLVLADEEDTALQRATALAHDAGVAFVRVRWPANPAAGLADLVALHAVARGVVPLVELSTQPGPGPAPTPSFSWMPGPAVLCGRVGAISIGGPRPILPVMIERLRPSDRVAMWGETLPELAEAAGALAARYVVEPSVAAAVARDARAAAAVLERPTSLDDVGRSVRQRTAVSSSGGIKGSAQNKCSRSRRNSARIQGARWGAYPCRM